MMRLILTTIFTVLAVLSTQTFAFDGLDDDLSEADLLFAMDEDDLGADGGLSLLQRKAAIIKAQPVADVPGNFFPEEDSISLMQRSVSKSRGPGTMDFAVDSNGDVAEEASGSTRKVV
mmetsp:Transcript_38003/g.80472  ORF Transcript_38003/g.80472 Transcript_38003/m.80472 type:complete len:118 (+) Transcript_38003:168-521(+)